jgi:hypothetical protein
MNLAALRTEVENRGFDPIQYGSRITQFINDGYKLVCQRVGWYGNETTDAISTVAGTASYSWPQNFSRMRSLFDTTRHVELEYVSQRLIDRSGTSNGAPVFYAIYAGSITLWPTPDAVYSLEMRYWSLPNDLVNDSDSPNFPATWHKLLWIYATWQCYEADDDAQMGQYWQGRFNNELAMFAADVKFPDSDGPNQAAGMWDAEKTLGPANQWTLYGYGW